MTHQLKFKAPQTNQIPTRVSEDGLQLFGGIAWTIEAVMAAREAGAWFGDSGDHHFATSEVARAAHMEILP